MAMDQQVWGMRKTAGKAASAAGVAATQQLVVGVFLVAAAMMAK